MSSRARTPGTPSPGAQPGARDAESPHAESPHTGSEATPHVRPGRAPRVITLALVFWPALIGVAAVDVVTKYLAHTRLVLHVPHEVVGDTVRITLAYNPGAAFGMSVGPASRWVFLALTAAILVFLGRLYRETPRSAVPRALALGLVCGGAVGNLVNRLWSSRGVVDFIDIGLGDIRFWTFNVADIGVSVGAVLLVWVLRREDTEEEPPTAGPRAHTADVNRSVEAADP